MIAIAFLLCVTMVASAPLEVPLPFDQSSSWSYYTTYTPNGNLGYTATYNANEKAHRVAFNQLPVAPAAFAEFQPYALAGVPSYGLRYFPGSPSPAYYPYGYQDPSENYEFEGNYETKSDAVEFEDEVDDLRNNNVNAQNSGTKPMNTVLNAIMNFNRFNILRLAFRNAMMMTLG